MRGTLVAIINFFIFFTTREPFFTIFIVLYLYLTTLQSALESVFGNIICRMNGVAAFETDATLVRLCEHCTLPQVKQSSDPSSI